MKIKTFLRTPAVPRLRLLATLLTAGLFLIPLRAQDFNAALDNSALTFTASQPCQVSPTGGADGGDFITSPVSSASGRPEITTTLPAPVWLVFWQRQGPIDLLVDGTVLQSFPGSTDWIQRSVQITGDGAREIKWRAAPASWFSLDAVFNAPSLAIPLETALPGFTWTTGGTHPWSGLKAPALRVEGRATATLPYSASQAFSSWIESTFTGPARISWRAWNTGVGPLPSVQINGIPMNISSWDTQTVSGFLPPGQHTVRWVADRHAAWGTPSMTSQPALEAVALEPVSALPFSEALGTPTLTWTTGGHAPWDAVTMGTGPLATKAALSGLLRPGEESWLQTSLTGPGFLSTSGDVPSGLSGVTTVTLGSTQLSTSIAGVFIIPPGTHDVRFRVRMPAITPATSAVLPRVRLHAVTWSPQQELPAAEALGSEGLTFFTPPAGDWFGMTNANRSGRTGVYLRPGGTLTARLDGPATLNWTIAASATPWHGPQLDCTMDGLPVDGPSMAGLSASLEVPPGEHVVTWSPRSGSSGCWFHGITRSAGRTSGFTDALGSAALTWQSSPEAAAFFLGDAGMASVLLAQPSNTPRLHGMTTTVSGPGIITLSIAHRSARDARVLVDAVPFVTRDTPGGEWIDLTIPIAAGTHSLTLTPPPDSTGSGFHPVYFLVRNAAWRPQSSAPLAEAVDAPALAFTTGGSAPWEGADDAGGDVARTGNLGAGQSSWLETTITGPGLLDFRFSGTPSISLAFSVNGVSGDFTRNGLTFFELGPGTHAVRWIASLPASPAPSRAGRFSTLDAVSWQAYLPQPLTSWPQAAAYQLRSGPGDWQRVAEPDRNGGGAIRCVPGSWLEATIDGPAAFRFAAFGRQGDKRSVSVSIDGAPSRRLDSDVVAMAWTDHTLFIPAGTHVVRWHAGSAIFPIIAMLDDFRVVPATEDLATALGWPGTTSATMPQRRWFGVLSPEWPESGAVFGESGLLLNELSADPQGSLRLDVSGPGRFTLPVRHADVIVNTSQFWRVTYSSGTDGWRAATFHLPPGTHDIRIRPNGSGPPAVDRVAVEPVTSPSFSSIFPSVSGSWTTSAENSFHPSTDPGLTTEPSAVITIPANGPGGWLEADLTGPATLAFSVTDFTGSLALWQVLVDGRPMPSIGTPNRPTALVGSRFRAGSSAGSDSYQIYLPPGPRRVRWQALPGEQGEPRVGRLLRVHGVRILPEAPLHLSASAPPLMTAGPPPQVLVESGTTFRRFASGGNRRFLSSAAGGPALVSIRWRAPITLPYPSSSYFIEQWIGDPPLSQDLGPHFFATRYLRTDEQWQVTSLFIRGDTNSMRLAAFIPIDIAEVTHALLETVPLDVAIGLPGTPVTTGGPGPWSGFRFPDGSTAAAPPDVIINSPRWLQIAVTGPAMLTWQSTALSTAPIYDVQIDGLPATRRLLSYDDFATLRMATFIPAGLHNVRMIVQSGITTGELYSLGGMALTPVPPAYIAWREGLCALCAVPPPASDDDRDGSSALAEFFWMTSPSTPTPPPDIRVGIEGGQPAVCVPAHRPLSDGVRLFFETSADLATWQRTAAEPIPGAPAGFQKYRLVDSPGNSSRFYVRAGVEFTP